MTLPQDLEGRLEELIKTYIESIHESLRKADAGDFTSVDLPNGVPLSTALTHLIEDYVVAARIETLEHVSLAPDLQMPPETFNKLKDMIEQLNPKEIK